MLTKNHNTLTIEVEKHIAADAVVQGNYWDGAKGCFIGCLAHSSEASALEKRFGLPLPLVRICEGVFEALPEDEAKAFFAAIPAAVGRDGKDLSRVHWGFLASELRELPEVPAEQQAVIDPVIAGMNLLFADGEWSDAARAPCAARAAGAARVARAAGAARVAYAASAAARAAYAADAAARAAYAADAAARVAYAADAAARAAYAADAAARAAYAADAAARAADAADAADAAYAASAAARAAARAVCTRRQRDTLLKLIKEA